MPSEHSIMRRDMMLLGAALSALSLGLPHVPPAAAAGVTTVFVAGASGSTGRRVVRELRKRGLTVRAGVRDVEKARANGLALDDNVVLVTADVTQPECEALLQRCSRWHCMHALPCSMRAAQSNLCSVMSCVEQDTGICNRQRTGEYLIVDSLQQHLLHVSLPHPCSLSVQAVISAIGYNGGADKSGYEAIDNKARGSL